MPRLKSYHSTFQEQGHLKGYARPGSLFPVACPQQSPEHNGLMFFWGSWLILGDKTFQVERGLKGGNLKG